MTPVWTGTGIAAVALLAATLAWGQGIDPRRAVVGRDAPNSAARFLAHCEQPAHFAFCDGYLLGAATTMTEPPLCLSETYPTERYRQDFAAWVKDRPAALDWMTVFAVIRFLQETFPCGGAPPGRGT